MKILLFTQDITVRNFPQKYNTGFSLMVAQIASALTAEEADVYVSSSSLTNDTTEIYSETGEKQFTLLGRKIRYLFRYLRLKDVPRAVRHAFSAHKIPISYRIKLLKYTLSIGFAVHLIRKINPDVIFIHSIGPEVLPFISASLQTKKPFVIALHGIFSPGNEHNLPTQAETRVLPQLILAGIPVTVVGSGMRKKLLEFCHRNECANIHVIPNALNIEKPPTHATNDILWEKRYRILAIGNLSRQKNQLQLLRAFALLPEEIRANGQLCLIGHDSLNGELQKEAVELGIDSACIFTGNLPHGEVFRWIKDAGVVALASKNEGFGLSIIEAYHYGVPAVCFDHLYAFEDFYHEKCTIAIHEDSDAAVAQALEKALTQVWDKEFIRTFAKRFSNHAMASSYLGVLQQTQPSTLTEQAFNRQVDKYL